LTGPVAGPHRGPSADRPELPALRYHVTWRYVITSHGDTL